MRQARLHILTWIRALAVLGVLLHAGLLVRHSVAAAGAVAAGPFGVMCHGNGTGLTKVPLPAPVDPTDQAANHCPICTGVAASAGLLPDVVCVPKPFADFADSLRPRAAARQAFQSAGLPPPARGPPARA